MSRLSLLNGLFLYFCSLDVLGIVHGPVLSDETSFSECGAEMSAFGVFHCEYYSLFSTWHLMDAPLVREFYRLQSSDHIVHSRN